jgi:hypothetical protein
MVLEIGDETASLLPLYPSSPTSLSFTFILLSTLVLKHTSVQILLINFKSKEIQATMLTIFLHGRHLMVTMVLNYKLKIAP